MLKFREKLIAKAKNNWDVGSVNVAFLGDSVTQS